MSSAADATEDLDEGRLQALLDLAGRDTAQELARRLVADLSAVALGLRQQRGPGDRQAIRAQSHVLLALSGTIGAARLNRAATRLNSLSQDTTAPALDPALDETLALLDRLLQRLAGCLSGMLAHR